MALVHVHEVAFGLRTLSAFCPRVSASYCLFATAPVVDVFFQCETNIYTHTHTRLSETNHRRRTGWASQNNV